MSSCLGINNESGVGTGTTVNDFVSGLKIGGIQKIIIDPIEPDKAVTATIYVNLASVDIVAEMQRKLVNVEPLKPIVTEDGEVIMPEFADVTTLGDIGGYEENIIACTKEDKEAAIQKAESIKINK